MRLLFVAIWGFAELTVVGRRDGYGMKVDAGYIVSRSQGSGCSKGRTGCPCQALKRSKKNS